MPAEVSFLLDWAFYALVFLVVLLLPRQFQRVPHRIFFSLSDGPSAPRSLVERVWGELVKVLGERSVSTSSSTKDLLRRAGERELAPETFFTIRVVAGCAGVALGLVGGLLIAGVIGALFGSALLGVLGYVAPLRVMHDRARHRGERAMDELPNWLMTYIVVRSSGVLAAAALEYLSRMDDGVLAMEGREACAALANRKDLNVALTEMGQRIAHPHVTSVLREIGELAEDAGKFDAALESQARLARTLIAARVRSRIVSNEQMAEAVSVLFAMPVILYVALVPQMMRLITLIGGV